MLARATSTLDERYLREYYRDSVRYLLKWKRWELPAGLFLLMAGLSIAFLSENIKMTAIVLVIVGLFELFTAFYSRHRWLTARRAEERFGETSSLTFYEDRIIHEGPSAQGPIEWDLIENIIPTPAGFFLQLGKGLSIYVPDSNLQPIEAKSKIIERFHR